MSDDAIAALLESRLVDASLHAAHAHLAECAACRDVWTAAANTQSHQASTVDARQEPEVVPTAPVVRLPRGTNVGRFVVLGVVGTGGMSLVYSAYDPELDRKVALKFLRLRHSESDTAAAQALRQRLQREAKAMARLAHPAVVTVHDIGTFAGDVFIAMEFVDGGTLSEWCGARARATDEIVALFLRVGEGLAAAHRVGIVHRDFKPSNVLVSRDGDVRITDFGLARIAHETKKAKPEDVVQTRDTAASLQSTMTATGALLGTPAYMAPEQFAGSTVDARSDQWSFCVALYEALHGKRPFVGGSVDELVRCVQEAVVQVNDRLPARVRRVLLRGLRRDPAARFASMDDLLVALRHDPWPARRRVLYTLGAVTLVGSALFFGYRAQHRLPICSGAERKLVGVFDASTRQAIREAFLRTGRPFAQDAFANVDRVLSTYAAGFVRMHTEACEATRLRAEQSEKLMDLRIGCLDLRRKDLAAVRDLFLRADSQIVERAQRIITVLPSLDACGNAHELLLSEPLPADPTVRSQVAELSDMLSKIRVLHSAGRYEPGLALLGSRLPQVRELGLRPLLAQYLHTLGNLQESTSHYEDAQKSYQEAIFSAEAGRADTQAAQSLITSLRMLAEWKPRDPQREYLRGQAAAALTRIGDPPGLRASYYVAEGIAQSELGDHEAARTLFLRAIPLSVQANGGESYDVARMQTNLGSVCRMLGRYDEAVQNHRSALAIADKLFGAEHPFTATIRTNLGNALSYMGRPEEALPLLRQALAVYDSYYSTQDMHTSSALLALGNALSRLERDDEAEVLFLRDLQMTEALLGRDHPHGCVTRRNLGEILLRRGKYAEAGVHFQETLRIAQRAYGADHPDVALGYQGLAHAERMAGRPTVALAHYRRAKDIFDRIQKQPNQDAIEGRLGIAACMEALGRSAETLPLLEQTLPLLPAEKNPEHDVLRASFHFALAKVLWRLNRPGDQERALGLAKSASALLSKLPTLPTTNTERKQIDGWLAGRTLR